MLRAPKSLKSEDVGEFTGSLVNDRMEVVSGTVHSCDQMSANSPFADLNEEILP